MRVAVGRRSTCVLKEAPLNKGPLGFPQFLRSFRASFRGKLRPEKIHQKSPPFFNAKFTGKFAKKIHKSLLESRQSKKESLFGSILSDFGAHPAESLFRHFHRFGFSGPLEGHPLHSARQQYKNSRFKLVQGLRTTKTLFYWEISRP